MFEHLKGRMTPASNAGRSKGAIRLNQALTLFVVVFPLVATLYAAVPQWAGLASWKDLALLGSFYLATSIGVTVGFHRMLTHNSFETNPIVRAIFLILGTWSIQGAAISWAAIHNKHHVHSDTPEDPHSPIRSFFHAHVGWLLGTERAEPERFAKGQLNDPVVMFVSRTAFWWAVLGMVLPFLIGGWSGFLWGSLVRVFLVHHVTWSVNSICHTFGQRPFKHEGDPDLSTNNVAVGLLAMGEGWHNNHHAFPRSAMHGLKWWQFDMSGYTIRVLGRLGLARNIIRVPKQVIAMRRAKGARRQSAQAAA